MTKTTKRIELPPGDSYQYTVILPASATAGLLIDCSDQQINLAPGDEAHFTITALPIRRAPPVAIAAAESLPDAKEKAS